MVDILESCNLKNNNNTLVIIGLEEKIKLNLNYIDPFYDYTDYLFTSDPEILLKESVILIDRKLKKENYFYIDKESNIEKSKLLKEQYFNEFYGKNIEVVNKYPKAVGG